MIPITLLRCEIQPVCLKGCFCEPLVATENVKRPNLIDTREIVINLKRKMLDTHVHNRIHLL